MIEDPHKGTSKAAYPKQKHLNQIRVMRKLDMEKVSKLPAANDLLDEKYGKEGTASRAEFDAKALAWYYGQ